MWALRRASVTLRSQGFNIRNSCACCVKLMPNTYVEDENGISGSPQITCNRFLSLRTFYHTGHASLKFTMSRRELSSQSDARSKKEDDDMEDRFSEVGTPVGQINDNNGNDDELICEQDLSDDNGDVEELHNELELSETEINPTEKIPQMRQGESELMKAILKFPASSVHSALEKWVAEGKELSRSVISLAMVNLRRRRMYGRALQLSEWADTKMLIELTEKSCASRVDLISEVHGLHKAEMYINSVPESLRGERIYENLLANCVKQNNVKKAEEIFNKIRDLELPVTTFTCNQLLLLYKRIDKKKIANVLLLMEKENIRSSHMTYKLLIDIKGMSNDIDGMEEIVEMMKDEGLEPDFPIQVALAWHYASAGLKEKAEAVCKEMEVENLKENRWICRSLLIIYANLGKAEEVGRIWMICESDPQIYDCMAAIEAWGKLKKIEEAEAVFEMMVNKWQNLSSKHYAVLLKVYANHKMLKKGKDLIKRIGDSGFRIGPLAFDALVKLYVQAGEVEMADSALQKAIQQKQMKPMYRTYLAILNQYARNGDIHNSEKIFYRIRQAGYTSRLRHFQALIQAYIKAKLPAYGIKERMKADNIFSNKALASQLIQVDAFRRTAVSDLLD